MTAQSTQQDFNDAFVAVQIFEKVTEDEYKNSSIVWADHGGEPGESRSYAAIRLKKERVDGLGIEGALELKSRPVAIAGEEAGSYVYILAFYREVNGGQEVNDGQAPADTEKKEE